MFGRSGRIGHRSRRSDRGYFRTAAMSPPDARAFIFGIVALGIGAVAGVVLLVVALVKWLSKD